VGSHSYTFVATETISGCEAHSNTVNLIVNQTPNTPVLQITDNYICSGDPVTVTGNVAGVYTWYRNGLLFAENAGNSIIDQPTANNILTPYHYTATVTLNGCTSYLSNQVSVTVHPTMSVTIAGAHEVCDQALAEGQLALHAVVTGGNQSGVHYEYTWTYVQGQNPAVTLVIHDNPYMVLPNNLPINDPAAPYCFNVEVKAVSYDCIAIAPTCHQIDIYAKPVVQITVDNAAVCLGGIITATANANPTETPERPYVYEWTVNGVTLALNQKTIPISSELVLGVNTISVTISRAYAPASCFGTNNINVNVVSAPSLELTQDIAGLDLTGMCVGGTVNLHATIVNFDATLIDPSGFNYQWRKGESLIGGANYSNYSDVLNTAGIYNYDVKAVYSNSSLGCNTVWTAFNPVKVVPQPTIRIAPKDDNLYDVCQYAPIEITVTPTIVDPIIQKGYQYKWNDEGIWYNFPILSPRTIVMNYIGIHKYFVEATFENPTCLATQSNEREFKVTTNPAWTEFTYYPPAYNGLCLGDEVELTAATTGGVNNETNVGIIQWMYSFNGGTFVNVQGIGGHKFHKPAQEGNYVYMATYTATNPLTGCQVDPKETEEYEVLQSITPSAKFVNTEIPQICLDDANNLSYTLKIEFFGTAPFHFTIRDSYGVVTHYVSYTNYFEIVVHPKATTVYTLEMMTDDSPCVTGTFVKSDITVVVTEVYFASEFVQACDGKADVILNIKSSVSKTAKITFPGHAPWYKEISYNDNDGRGILTIDIPSGTVPGTYKVVITIDDCDYDIYVVFNGADNQLLVRRWEGYGEVLAINNNPETNGGFKFDTYQWYKDGILVPGATKQYYQDPNGVYGVYSVHVKGTIVSTGAPIEMRTCELTFVPSNSINVYPVPSQINQPVFVELNLTPEELEGAVLDIYDAKGAHVKHVQVTGSLTKVDGFKAQGTCFGRIITGTDEIKTVKFVIVK
jgi:hypothetical protein